MTGNLGKIALLVVGFVAAALVWVLAWQNVSQAPVSAGTSFEPQPEPTATSPERLAVLGDSYSRGTELGGLEEQGWPAIVAGNLNASLNLQAVGGTGYVSEGDEGGTFQQRARDLVDGGGDLVLVFGSRNDSFAAPTVLEQNVSTTLDYLTESLPDAQVVAIGPAWPADFPPGGDPEAARAAVEAGAENVGVPFIDPVAEGWLDDPTLIGEDEVHPTDEGHEEIARLVLRDLKRLDLIG